MNVPKLVFQLLLGRRFPIADGEVRVRGAEQPVSIRRDAHGIPYIEAATDKDAWYGLGFCHGQDRAFQLESMLRVVRGTMAEVVGPAALPIDRLSRRIGFYYAAEQQLQLVSDEIRHMMEAYAQGATEGARIGSRRLAHEFTLLGCAPSVYTATDVLGAIKLMSLSMTFNWDCELVRLKVLREDGPEALKALDHTYPVWKLTTPPHSVMAGSAVDRLAEDMEIFMATVGYKSGSNNWVTAPSRTTTGRPILANDPHVGPALPSIWYLAHIRTPDWAVAGASFVGSPAIAIGHNGVAAWGMTAGVTDASDLFIEEVGADGQSVREGEQFAPCEVRREVIRVKGAEAVEEQVLMTRRGPIIGPALAGEVGAVSMCTTWLKPYPIDGLLRMHRVRSFKEFSQAFEQWPALPMNMVYADTSGDIGWQLVGQIPRRRKGWGTIPLAGWDPEAGWEEALVPLKDMPSLYNPKAGFIVTANAQPISEKKSHPFLGVDWVDGYRMARITEMLDSRQDWDVASTTALQRDQLSIPWREIKKMVLSLPANNEPVRQALDLLKSWDGILSDDAPAGAVYEFFITEMIGRVTRAKAPRAADWILCKSFVPLMARSFLMQRRTSHLIRVLIEQPAGWFKRSWPEEMADGLAAAVTHLRQCRGSDPSRWGWGRVRQLTLPHPVGAQAPLDRIFNLGPVPCGGDVSTVAQAACDWLDLEASPLAIASLRMVLDVGNWDESRFILPGGQSGNPLSPHYGDQLPLWLRGEGVPIAWSPERVSQITQTTLLLLPGID